MAAIPVNNPVVVPEHTVSVTVPSTVTVPQKTYNEIWLSKLTVDASPDGVCHVRAIVDVACDNGDGTKTLGPASARKVVNVPNFFADASQSELAVMYQIVQMIKARASI
jgi:hypothetical protein